MKLQVIFAFTSYQIFGQSQKTDENGQYVKYTCRI